MRKNPLRLDPSRTTLTRRSATAELNRRFNALRKAVWQRVAVDNVYNLTKPTTNAPNPQDDPKARLLAHPRYQFETDAQKLDDFNRWLERQINLGFYTLPPTVMPAPGLGAGTPQPSVLGKFVFSAYKQGTLRAYLDAHKTRLAAPQSFHEGTQEEFLRSSFGRPERISKVQMLYTRSYQNLKGVTTQMSAQMSRVLADGMVQGKGAMEVARTLSKTITGVPRTRANVIARTEIIHAHAEGQLDGYSDLGVTEVGADVEFTTSDDDGVCPQCEALDGEVFTIQEARGVIPVHPNCRCAWSMVVHSTALDFKR